MAETKKKVAKKTATKKADEAPKETAAEKKAKLAKLMEKAKSLESGIADDVPVKLKDKVKKKDSDEPEEAKDALVPIEDYLKSSIHLGTRVITPDMRSYVYKRRADGLAVFNTAMLDDKIKEAAEYLAKFAPEDIVVICKREAGWYPVKMFAKVLGIRNYTKKYPAGILTNPNLEDFIETELIFICDPWLDKNALKDSNDIGIPVMSVCDTNNYTKGVDQILPGNNKSAKSLGMIFYLLTKIYAEKRKMKIDLPPIADWIENWENLSPPK
tara:strand:+ start:1576 stop:2385 length:810 start_codon:yes stop_codon:yes gene_type:complete